jgi:hypothetical protein
MARDGWRVRARRVYHLPVSYWADAEWVGYEPAADALLRAAPPAFGLTSTAEIYGWKFESRDDDPATAEVTTEVTR